MAQDMGKLVAALQKADAAGDTQAAQAIAAAIKQQQKPSFQQQAATSFLRVAPLAENVGSMTVNSLAQIPAGFAGMMAGNRRGPGGADAAVRASEKTQIFLSDWAQPRSEKAQMYAQELGKVGQKVDDFADKAGDVLGGDSPAAETAVKTLLLGGGTLLGARGVPKVRAAKSATPKAAPVKAPNEAPSVDQLRESANQAYDKAENSGVFIKKEAYSGFVNDLKETMAKQGIDKGLHPKAFRAMKRVMQDADQNLTLKGAETIRRNIGDAASSMDKADQRMALIMRDKLDEFMEGLDDGKLMGNADAPGAVKSLTEARGMWSRVRKAEEIQDLIDRATMGKSKFSQSGMENSLRTEFRNLAKNKKRMRRFSKEEQAAIRRVSEGGTMGNMMRFVGRYAPTGPVSSAIAAGIGASIGGPAGAMAFGGAGALGRMGATASTMKNARLAEELMRRGPKVDPRKQAMADQLAK